MNDLQTIQELNARAALNRAALEICANYRPPTPLGDYYVFEQGDVLLISKKPEFPCQPIMAVDFAGERPAGPGKIRQLFQTTTWPDQKAVVSVVDRASLSEHAAALGIPCLDDVLDRCYGKETYAV